MSYVSPTTTHGGPASSPHSMGTPATQFSPDVARNARGQPSAVAAGKQPVIVASSSVKQPGSFPAGMRTERVFANELLPEDPTFISRYLYVKQHPDGIVAGTDQDAELQSVQARMKQYTSFLTSVPVYSRGVHIRFDNLSHSCDAKYLLECLGYAVDYETQYHFSVAKSQDTATIDEFEGQIRLEICIDPMSRFCPRDITEVNDSVLRLMGTFGDVREALHHSTNNTQAIVVFRVEFQSIDAANRAVRGLKTNPYWGESKNSTWQWVIKDCAPWVGPSYPDSPQSQQPRIDDQGRLAGFLHQPARIPTEQYTRHPGDQHNRVLKERILVGADVRTTVMLRNIPNKLDWLSLKALLDRYCFGFYDFVYLRIDFKSGCNVGYAFINFTDVRGMLSMVDEIEQRTWLGYRSAKAAEISYATIQGKEALIQKFRNSSVMQETPFCRPRLFHSFEDAFNAGSTRLTATEVEFPPPDNPAKLQRSMDSARTVGLYPPHGMGNTTDHRNRTSAYDRGTPRDLVQSATTYVPPTSFQHVPERVKRMVEHWYSQTYGTPYFDPIPFDYIPPTFVTHFLTSNTYAANLLAAPTQDPGVIGRPAPPVPVLSNARPIVHGYPVAGLNRERTFRSGFH